MRKNSQILAPLYEVVSVVVVVKVGVAEVVVRRSKRVLEGTTHGVGSGCVPMKQASRGSVEGRWVVVVVSSKECPNMSAPHSQKDSILHIVMRNGS